MRCGVYSGGRLKCTQCGGFLLWDYERGEVVCSLCGLVHDRLTSLEVTDYRTMNDNDENIYSKAINKPKATRWITSKEYRYKIKLYKKGLKLTKNKPWLEVDYEKVFENGRFIYTIKSKASMEALRNININGYWDVVREGLEYINSVNPAYLARSERSRYALAFMVAIKLKTGRYPSRESITHVFNISDTSYRRLYTVAEKIVTSSFQLHQL